MWLYSKIVFAFQAFRTKLEQTWAVLWPPLCEAPDLPVCKPVPLLWIKNNIQYLSGIITEKNKKIKIYYKYPACIQEAITLTVREMAYHSKKRKKDTLV